MSVALVYPSDLPHPQAISTSWPERRALSSDPFVVRAIETDRRMFQDIQFPPMTPAQAASFRSWWKDTLLRGATWWAATWPLPAGIVAGYRRFIAPPKRTFIPGGMWSISATVEVMGAGLPPVDYRDEFFAYVVALNHFDEAVPNPNPSLNSAVFYDELGNGYQIRSQSGSVGGQVTGGELYLPADAGGAGYANVCQCLGGAIDRPGFDADGDFCIEFSLRPNDYPPYSHSGAVVLLSSMSADQPTNIGEWVVKVSNNYISFEVRFALGGMGTNAVTTTNDSWQIDHLADSTPVRVSRKNGDYSIFTDGVLRHHTTGKNDNVRLSATAPTFGGWGDASGMAFNTFGNGVFDEFRFTNGVSRDLGSPYTLVSRFPDF
jgi:hypothetical protein